jgi:hypothetical protein
VIQLRNRKGHLLFMAQGLAGYGCMGALVVVGATLGLAIIGALL